MKIYNFFNDNGDVISYRTRVHSLSVSNQSQVPMIISVIALSTYRHHWNNCLVQIKSSHGSVVLGILKDAKIFFSLFRVQKKMC